MRVLLMGQTGLDKKGYLEALNAVCVRHGSEVGHVFNVGDMMYDLSRAQGRTVPQGKILDLPLPELRLLRRLAFEAIVRESSGAQNVLVNSHSVFRWNSQLFSAIDLSEVKAFAPDMVITIIDDVDAIKLRLDSLKGHSQLPRDVNYTLKDIIVWREEEVLVSDLLASVLEVPHFVMGAWLEPGITVAPQQPLYRLIFQADTKRAYASYPISGARNKAVVWNRVNQFRKLVHTNLTAFDPLSIDERRLAGILTGALSADPGADTISIDVRGEPLDLPVREVQEVLPDIEGQIVARDYKLIDQSDAVVAYFPRDEDGSPIIAGGVQSEIEHAAAATKEIVIVWEADREPTPFIGLRVDYRLGSLTELEAFLPDWSHRKLDLL